MMSIGYLKTPGNEDTIIRTLTKTACRFLVRRLDPFGPFLCLPKYTCDFPKQQRKHSVYRDNTSNQSKWPRRTSPCLSRHNGSDCAEKGAKPICCSSGLAADSRDLLGDRLSGRGSARIQHQQNDGTNGTSGNGLGLGRAGATVFADLELDIGGKIVDLLGSELVVDQTAQGDGVTEELLGGDGVTEDHHGGADQEDILEDTGHGQNNGGGLANLEES